MATKATNPIHRPVLAREVVKLLITDRDGSYFDLTVGLGGHLKAIAGAVSPGARLYGIDKDPAAVALARKDLDSYGQIRSVIRAGFGDIEQEMRRLGETAMDGILIDLGLSSLQLDDATRGFSFRFEGPLDMRFDQQSPGSTAADLVASLSAAELTAVIRSYGEERHARRLAQAIIRARDRSAIRTTTDLARSVLQEVPPPHRTKSLARVFQALRIAVNDELGQLEAVLPKALALLKVGGRLAVISYHSLEDRLVKRYFQREARGCTCPPRIPQCVCGAHARLRLITRRAITPGPSERQRNPRARSAKLRVSEKVAA